MPAPHAIVQELMRFITHSLACIFDSSCGFNDGSHCTDFPFHDTGTYSSDLFGPRG